MKNIPYHQQLHYHHLRVTCSMEKCKTKSPHFLVDLNTPALHSSLEVRGASDWLSNTYLTLCVVSENEKKRKSISHWCTSNALDAILFSYHLLI